MEIHRTWAYARPYSRCKIVGTMRKCGQPREIAAKRGSRRGAIGESLKSVRKVRVGFLDGRPVEQRTSASSRAMLEPRLIVRQSFLIRTTRGPTGFKGRKGQARVRLARTSAAEVGEISQDGEEEGQKKEMVVTEKGGGGREEGDSVLWALYKLSYAEGEDPVGPPRALLSAFRHLNVPRTPLPGLVSPSLFLSYFRVSSWISLRSLLKDTGVRVWETSHTRDSRVSSLFPIDLRICSLFDHGSFFLFDGSASRLPHAHSRIVEWIVSWKLNSTLAPPGRYITAYPRSTFIMEYSEQNT